MLSNLEIDYQNPSEEFKNAQMKLLDSFSRKSGTDSHANSLTKNQQQISVPAANNHFEHNNESFESLHQHQHHQHHQQQLKNNQQNHEHSSFKSPIIIMDSTNNNK
jgi:hypothetical protein